jgi:hypothetical protein
VRGTPSRRGLENTAAQPDVSVHRSGEALSSVQSIGIDTVAPVRALRTRRSMYLCGCSQNTRPVIPLELSFTRQNPAIVDRTFVL